MLVPVFSEKVTVIVLSVSAVPLVSIMKLKCTFGSKVAKFAASPGTMKPCTVMIMTTLELSVGSTKK